MRYRKIKAVSVHANSPKNLVLRQQFAIEFLKLWQKRKRIINVDETWLGMSDFRRMKWRPPDSTNSVAKLEIRPRVTMIAAVDNYGKIYMSLL